MPLESTSAPIYPNQLDPAWPLDSDAKSEGDDHIRNLKAALLNFWTKVNFSNLPEGAVPTYVGGRFWDSGLAFTNGQGFTLRPFVSPMHIQAGGLNPTSYQLIGVPLLDIAVKRPITPTVNGISESPIQTDDTEVNTLPVAWSFIQDSDAWVKGIVVRGAALVTGVRFTLRESNSLGAILYQSASDAELFAGGGGTIAASGDSTLLFPQKLEVFAGNSIHVAIERYDSISGTIVGTGIVLKGKVISGTFIPYQRSIRQAVTRKPVAVKSDLPVLSFLAEGTAQTVGTTAVSVGSFVFNNTDPTGVFYMDLAVFFQGVPNGCTITTNVYVNGVLLDTGGGVTSRCRNEAASMSFSSKADLPITLNAGANTLEVRALVSTGTAQKLLCKLAVCRADTGGVWA